MAENQMMVELVQMIVEKLQHKLEAVEGSSDETIISSQKFVIHHLFETLDTLVQWIKED